MTKKPDPKNLLVLQSLLLVLMINKMWTEAVNSALNLSFCAVTNDSKLQGDHLTGIIFLHWCNCHRNTGFSLRNVAAVYSSVQGGFAWHIEPSGTSSQPNFTSWDLHSILFWSLGKTSQWSRLSYVVGDFRRQPALGETPRKYTFLLCSHRDFESAVTAQNDEFKAVFIAHIHTC